MRMGFLTGPRRFQWPGAITVTHPGDAERAGGPIGRVCREQEKAVGRLLGRGAAACGGIRLRVLGHLRLQGQNPLVFLVVVWTSGPDPGIPPPPEPWPGTGPPCQAPSSPRPRSCNNG